MRTSVTGAARTESRQQLSLFGVDSVLAGDLAELDVDSLTPLEAIGALYELCSRARRIIHSD